MYCKYFLNYPQNYWGLMILLFLTKVLSNKLNRVRRRKIRQL